MMRDLKSQLMTGRMAEVALDYVRGSRTPVDPRPASTVILLRDAPATATPAATAGPAVAAAPAATAGEAAAAVVGAGAPRGPGGPEVYLLRRQRTMAENIRRRREGRPCLNIVRAATN